MSIDPFELIKKFRPGMANIGRAKQKVADPWTTIFLIREEQKYINKLGRNPGIEVKAALIAEEGVAAVFIQFRINLDWEQLYDVWLNYNNASHVRYFQDLAIQDMFLFKFYDDQEERRTIGIKNHLRPIFEEYIKRVGELPPWSMKDFDALKERIYARYPTGRDTWLKMFE